MNWYRSALFCVATAVTLAACAEDPVSPGGGNATLAAPAIDAPTDDEQLNTLRPAIVVRNSTSSSSGSRTYEFQLATSDAFTSIAVTRSGVPEGSGGRTSFTAPSPHCVYLSANELQFGGEDGISPGATIRNVWLSDRSRPATLGSAVCGR